jgi:hypothetical protein
MYDSILPSISKEVWDDYDRALTILIFVILIEFVTVLVLWIEVGCVSVHLRAVLKLLLHCPPVAVLQTPAIVSVLCGEAGWRCDAVRDGERDAEFFEPIFLRMPDAVLCMDENFTSTRLFEENFAGRNFSDFLHSDKFRGRYHRERGDGNYCTFP